MSQKSDQFAPFRAFGCTLDREFNGTLFRFPLRTPEQATKSRISRQAHTLESAQALLDDFMREASAMLLFLKTVESVQVFTWAEGAAAPTETFCARVANVSQELRGQRSFVLSAVEAASVAAQTKDADGIGGNIVTSDYTMEITSGVDSASGLTRQTWVVCNQLGGGHAGKIASDPDYLHMRLVPWAGVAALVASTDWANGQGGEAAEEKSQGVAPLDGRGYCFLPLPVHTHLPVHVNGYFELSSNRRDIWFGDDMAGDGRLRAEWNTSLLRDLVCPCYRRLLLRSANMLGPSPVYHSLFPVAESPPPWNTVPQSLYSQLADARVLHTPGSGSGTGSWVTPTEALVLGPDSRRLAAEALTANAAEAGSAPGPQRLSSVLLTEGLCLVDVPLVRLPRPLPHMSLTLCGHPLCAATGFGGGLAQGSGRGRSGSTPFRSEPLSEASGVNANSV